MFPWTLIVECAETILDRKIHTREELVVALEELIVMQRGSADFGEVR